MKKLNLLFVVIIIFCLTSMMQSEKDAYSKKMAAYSETNNSTIYSGTITIKVKEGVGEFSKQEGIVKFNIPSLDKKVDQFRIDKLEGRFKYNPKKVKKEMPDLSRIYRIEFPEEFPVTRVAREFSNDSNIEYAEPVPIIYFCDVPNDPMYIDQYFLPQIYAEDAWGIHKGEDGNEEVIIGIVDTGVEWDHEDLVDNIWQNLGEDADGDGQTLEFIGGIWVFDPDDENGVDDDENGYIDDFIGWNFDLNSNDPNPIPGIWKWHHGTLMSGYANATTNNNMGVAGVSWNLKTLPVQLGYLHQSKAYDAIIYAAENGADVISNSWGHYELFSQANYEAITYAQSQGSIIVAATGNHNQYKKNYPSSYPGVIAVAAVNQLDEKASYSNFGPHVKVCAPGGDYGYPLLTTDVNNGYYATSGTSCATPIVAGLLGLVKSYYPDWTSDQVITQVLGTADAIDAINLDFENLLGSGRINAYRALTDSATLEQEIALDLFQLNFQDSDSNDMLEPGDTVNLTIELRNYNYGVGADGATFSLITEDPEVELLNDTYSADIPPDNYFTLENAFEFKISEQATTHVTNFKLITTADKEITWGDTIFFELVVAPAGVLVYQGEGLGNAFSGDFINEYLVDQGMQVIYTSHFPCSFNGFDAVFLSYGNYDESLWYGVIVTPEMTETIIDYLMQGGNLYAEGSFFGIMNYYGNPSLGEAMQLFGVDTLETPLSTNYINLLTGQPGSICEDIIFTGSSQIPIWYIDILTPDENGVAAFEEDDYGIVAVQGEGDYGQKTFCFSYALAHLEDNSQGTRDELMGKIIEFFDLLDPKADFVADTTHIYEGDTIIFTDLSSNSPTSWEWSFEGGTPEYSTNQNSVVVYNTPGIYDVTLVVSNIYGTDSLTINDYINVDPATGVVSQTSNQVLYYPVPVKDRLYIRHGDIIRSIEILNISGQVINGQEVNDNLTSIKTGSLSSGLYFIRIKLRDKEVIKKIIKTK